MNFSRRIDFSASVNALEQDKAALIRHGTPLIDLSQSNPTKTGFEHSPEELALAFASAENRFYRPDPKGLAAARQAIASRFPEGAKDIGAERILLCASTSEAYSYLFKLLCDPGDAILVPRPGYPLFEQLAALESIRALGYRLEYSHPSGWNIDIESIEKILASPDGAAVRALVLINPNNPTGSYVHKKELGLLIDICRRRSIPLISDEVFYTYALEPREGRLSLLGNRDILCFVLDGLSKRLCLPQVKLGWITVCGPDAEAQKAMAALELISDSFLSAGTPVMNGLDVLLAGEGQIGAAMRKRMAEVLAVYREVLCYEGSPHRILACEGGWTALVQSPRFDSEEELARGLLRGEGVYVHPGYFFDMEKEAYFAFSLIVKPQLARQASLKYRSYFDTLSKRVLR